MHNDEYFGNPLLEACKRAYRKHHLNDDSIGWNELSNILHDAMCNYMGDDEFIEWLKEIKNEM